MLAIAVELDYSQKTVRCWLHRFNRRLGLQGLEDLVGKAANDGSPSKNARGSFPWSRLCQQVACGGSPSGNCGPSTSRAGRVDAGFPGRGSACGRD
ncbi:hypothetical protein [Streptomyces sp. NPDC055109]